MAGILFLRDIDDDILMRCHACGHQGVLPHAAVERRFGPNYPVLSIAPHYRCSRCHSKDITSQPAPPAHHAPPPTPAHESDEGDSINASLAALQGLLGAVRGDRPAPRQAAPKPAAPKPPPAARAHTSPPAPPPAPPPPPPVPEPAAMSAPPPLDEDDLFERTMAALRPMALARDAERQQEELAEEEPEVFAAPEPTPRVGRHDADDEDAEEDAEEDGGEDADGGLGAFPDEDGPESDDAAVDNDDDADNDDAVDPDEDDGVGDTLAALSRLLGEPAPEPAAPAKDDAAVDGWDDDEWAEEDRPDEWTTDDHEPPPAPKDGDADRNTGADTGADGDEDEDDTPPAPPGRRDRWHRDDDDLEGEPAFASLMPRSSTDEDMQLSLAALRAAVERAAEDPAGPPAAAPKTPPAVPDAPEGAFGEEPADESVAALRGIIAARHAGHEDEDEGAWSEDEPLDLDQPIDDAADASGDDIADDEIVSFAIRDPELAPPPDEAPPSPEPPPAPAPRKPVKTSHLNETLAKLRGMLELDRGKGAPHGDGDAGDPPNRPRRR